MSVRAYLVHKDVKIIDDKEYVHEDLEYLWNNWGEYEIIDVLFGFYNDMTNEDFIGEIEIVDEDWERFKEKYNRAESDSTIRKVVNQHKEVFQTLDQYFKEGNYWATIKMY